MSLKIRSVSVSGFRAYGATEQTLNLPADLSAVWGPNSKGKTSLAEAFEFLLTGGISRRELMASTQDEFAEALRNVHLSPQHEVFVSARLLTPDGQERQVKRVLVRDFGKKQDSESRILIDGQVRSQTELEALGLKLSQPPLRAPVLAQHTLAYIFSVRPQDRATYFKAVLEVGDLEAVRADIAALAAAHLALPESPLLASLDHCTAHVLLRLVLTKLQTKTPGQAAFDVAISDAAGSLIEGAGGQAPEALPERIEALEAILEELRGKAFPVAGFKREQLPPWVRPRSDLFNALTIFEEERAKVEAETQRLIALFIEALKLPGIAGLETAKTCPLCGTDDALTPERVAIIRQDVAKVAGFSAAEAAAKAALAELEGKLSGATEALRAALPHFLKTGAERRRKAGFTVARLRVLLGDQADELVGPWLLNLNVMARRATRMNLRLAHAQSACRSAAADMEKLHAGAIEAGFEAIAAAHIALIGALEAYDQSESKLRAALNIIVDNQADTQHWQDFIDIAKDKEGLRSAILDRRAVVTVQKEHEVALKEIDRAKEAVMEERFKGYSDLVDAWWQRLRPDEPTFFSSVQPRKGAKRTIDFKAGLTASGKRDEAKLRDVIAVFSQSQLHCLGLALFLARAEREGPGFVVLDDPVLSSDEDYRVHFNTTVISALLALPVQVIVLTQDKKTWDELEIRYRHIGLSTAQIYIDQPVEGSIIQNTSDELLAKITRARSLARAGHPDGRKECGLQLRDAGERFCKEMLVMNDRANGKSSAQLSDYEGKTLEWLCPHVSPLLTRDPSHPGKLEAFRATVNDACHDNSPPSTGSMTQAVGEISFLQKTYVTR